MVNQVLIFCGPTATGKTAFALDVAAKFHGELISADSRQVYIGMDIVTGKDIPAGFSQKNSRLRWRDRYLTYYSRRRTRLWLTDIVFPDEPFNVAYWHECASLVIADIYSRHKLPIVVGGTGLYLKSLTQNLSHISIPPNPQLRQTLLNKDAKYLFNYLNRIDSEKAASLNRSDRLNPRRLVRAIEITLSNFPVQSASASSDYHFLTIGLTASPDVLYGNIKRRIRERLQSGAAAETRRITDRYGWNLPSLTACGYPAFKTDNPESAWLSAERTYLRRQLTWFGKQPNIKWFDISVGHWQNQASHLIEDWYNIHNAQKG